MDMYGYASRKCGASSGTHDPLMAKVLVLESAATRLAIVTLDLGSIVSERLRREASKLGVSLLLLSASHTHSGPLFIPYATGEPVRGGPEYLDELERKILRAIQEASDSLFTARLRTGRGDIRLGYNRLLKRENGRARALFDNLDRLPLGPLDSEYMLLEVTDQSGAPKALLTHYAAHPVVLGPTNCKYSADFPGAAHAMIQAALPGVQSMFVQGGAGDINPIFQGRSGKEDADFALVKKMGELLAADVLKTRSTLREVSSASLPIRAKSEVLRFNDRWSPHRAHDIGIATALVGRDIAIGAMPGEPLHRLQTTWKHEADVPFPLFYAYTYSAGGSWPGYVPDLRSAAYGGYGADSSTTRVEVGAGERIVQKLLTNLYELRGFWGAAPGIP